MLDLSRWFSSFPGPPGWLIPIALIVFILWTLTSCVVYFRRRQIFRGNGALIGMGTRFGWYAISIGLIGLFLVGMRYAQIPYLDMPFLLALDCVAGLSFLGFLVYYRWRHYPARRAQVQAHELRRRYAPERRRRKRRSGASR